MGTSLLEAPPATAPPVPRRYEDLPGPRGLPLLGNALQIDRSRSICRSNGGAASTHDMTIADVQVPADTVVFDMLRRDSASDSHLPRAAAFEPERWLEGGAPGQQASSAKRLSMPFGAGPRTCPGRYLALLEMKMAMAVLLGRFDIESVDTQDGQPPRAHRSFTMTPVGLRMRLRART